VFAAILAIDANAIAALSDFPAPATPQRPFGGREYIRRLPIAKTCLLVGSTSCTRGGTGSLQSLHSMPF
jgi:hypothetical protein